MIQANNQSHPTQTTTHEQAAELPATDPAVAALRVLARITEELLEDPGNVGLRADAYGVLNAFGLRRQRRDRREITARPWTRRAPALALANFGPVH